MPDPEQIEHVTHRVQQAAADDHVWAVWAAALAAMTALVVKVGAPLVRLLAAGREQSPRYDRHEGAAVEQLAHVLRDLVQGISAGQAQAAACQAELTQRVAHTEKLLEQIRDGLHEDLRALREDVKECAGLARSAHEQSLGGRLDHESHRYKLNTVVNHVESIDRRLARIENVQE